MALVTPPPTCACAGRPANRRLASACVAIGHRLHRAEVVGLQVGGDHRALEVAIDEAGQVLLVAAHRVEQQVLRDPLRRVGELAAARPSMARLICLSRSTIDTTLPTGSGWCVMNVAELVHPPQHLGVLDRVGRVALDQHLDHARAGQARVGHAEAVHGRVALEELRAQAVARLQARQAGQRHHDEHHEHPEDRALLAAPDDARELLEDRIEVLLALLALGLLGRRRRHQHADRRDERHLDGQRRDDAERRAQAEVLDRRQPERGQRAEAERRDRPRGQHDDADLDRRLDDRVPVVRRRRTARAACRAPRAYSS